MKGRKRMKERRAMLLHVHVGVDDDDDDGCSSRRHRMTAIVLAGRPSLHPRSPSPRPSIVRSFVSLLLLAFAVRPYQRLNERDWIDPSSAHP